MSLNVFKVAKQYPDFTQNELREFIDQFKSFDLDGSGSIDEQELSAVLGALKLDNKPEALKKYIEEVDLNKNGQIEFDEFMQIVKAVKSGADTTTGFAQVYVKQSKVVKVEGAGGAQHAFAEEEKEAFVEHINDSLAGDADLAHLLPIDPSTNALFDACRDGILLCKLINHSVPGTIDPRVINVKKPNAFKVVENHNLCINSAKAIGCHVINVGYRDLQEGRIHLVLGLVWQIVKIGLFQNISITNHPGLTRLLLPGEGIQDLLALPTDQLLLRWFNYHLAEANHPRRVKNFSGDIKDGENYTVLLAQIAPKLCDRSPLQQSDLTARAEAVLVQADKLGCRKFVKPKDIVKGNSKLNLAFVANLFNKWPALEPPEEEVEIEAIQETREEKAFRNWLNHFGLSPQVSYLYTDLNDGVVLLQVLDKLKPGIVNWKRVTTKRPMMKFKAIENTNYAVELGKQLNFSLVGVGGVDIHDGNKMLTLALVWQMMRYHVVSILSSLSAGGKPVTDKGLVEWANAKVASSGASSSIKSFKDKSISNGTFLVALLNAVVPDSIPANLVTPGTVAKDALLNAQLVISSARKVGCTVFLLPEDIVEIKAKMIMTLVGSIAGLDETKSGGASSQ